MWSPCLCALSASTSIHPPIPTFGRYLLEIFLNFYLILLLATTTTTTTTTTTIILLYYCGDVLDYVPYTHACTALEIKENLEDIGACVAAVKAQVKYEG